MKFLRTSNAPLVIFSLGLFLLPPAAKADTDAVTVLAQAGTGYFYGGVGFSFTPTTNLNVTRVGYLQFGASNPIITFWSNTNFPMASYPLVAGPNYGEMVYSNVSLVLLAGQRYSITLQDGSLSAGNFLSFLGSGSGQYQVATQLTAYVAASVNSAGVFGDFTPDALYFGPNFSYQIQTAPLLPPLLNIARSNANTLIVSWTAPAPGFVLQQVSSPGASNWALVTNAVSVVNGTNQVILSPVTGNRFFRLQHP